jgi:hypothetical protein
LQVDFRSRSKSMHALGQVGFQDEFETKKRRTKKRKSIEIIPNPNHDRIFCAASIRADKEQESNAKQAGQSFPLISLHPGIPYLRRGEPALVPRIRTPDSCGPHRYPPTLLAGVHVSRSGDGIVAGRRGVRRRPPLRRRRAGRNQAAPLVHSRRRAPPETDRPAHNPKPGGLVAPRTLVLLPRLKASSCRCVAVPADAEAPTKSLIWKRKTLRLAL